MKGNISFKIESMEYEGATFKNLEISGSYEMDPESAKAYMSILQQLMQGLNDLSKDHADAEMWREFGKGDDKEPTLAGLKPETFKGIRGLYNKYKKVQ